MMLSLVRLGIFFFLFVDRAILYNELTMHHSKKVRRSEIQASCWLKQLGSYLLLDLTR